MLHPTLRFMLIVLGIGITGTIAALVGDATRNESLLIIGFLLLGSCPVMIVIWLYYRFWGTLIANFTKMKDQTAELKQKNLLKRRFHGKRQLIDETDKHRSDLTRDLNKKTNKDKQDEILAEFFAGIGLDMKAIKFSEAKEIVLEELKNKKTTK